AVSSYAAPQKPADAKPAFDRAKFDIPYERFVLDNGLTLLVHEDHTVPVVGVHVAYHVGSRNEKRGKTGFAHLFEHFFFNGSENYPHGFREAMDDLGANNRNGSTTPDRTNFVEDVPVSALARTLYLEADRMGFLAGNINDAMLTRERGVVQNEKRSGENQPYGRAYSRIVEMIYPYSHPYSWSTIGSMEDLEAASLDDVKEWYRTYYGPNNAVLVLAGDITPQRAHEMVKKYFGGIPPGPPLARAEEWIPRFERNVRDVMEDRVPQTRIYRVYHAPGWGDPRLDHLSLVTELLSGSKSARLDRKLVYEQELVTDVSAFTIEREIAGALIVQATVKQGVDPARVEREIDNVVADLVKNGPAAEELRRAQSRILSSFVRSSERLGAFDGRAAILAESAIHGATPDAYLDRLETAATATAADVQNAAKTWLATNHYTLAVVPFPQLTPGKTEVDRKVLPTLGEAPEVQFPAVQRATLSNGMKVVVLERHSVPLVNFVLAVDAGHSTDTAAKAGLASLALDAMDEGTATRDGFEIADDLDAYGARLTTDTLLDLSLTNLETLAMNVRPALEIFADVVTKPSFPEGKVSLLRTDRLARIRQEQAQPNAAAMRIIPRLLYGENHPYAKPLTGSGYETSVKALTRDELVAWHRTWFHPNNSTMIVGGDITLQQAVTELERAFGTWKRGEVARRVVAEVPRSAGKKIYLIDKPDAPQSVIIATHVADRGGAADDLAVEVVMRNFGGMSTSRLMRNLRMDKHWSYGATASISETRAQRPFLVVAPVQSDKTKEAILEVLNELRGVAGTRPIEGDEYASVMRNQTMRLPATFETVNSLTAAALRMHILGRPDDYYANYARNVRTLTADALNAAGKKIIHPDEVIWVIVGDLKKIEPGIRELNLGEVV
ncbi:MAG TPA: pitrilysin family protein, partial [Thermoanaerobaculia bacterium]